MNPWSYIVGAYLVATVGVVGYLASMVRKIRVVRARVEALKRQGQGMAR